MTVPESSPETKPSIHAAVVMYALEIMRDQPQWPRTASEAITLLGASRSQAYEMVGRLKDAIGTLCGLPGRPRESAQPDAATAVTRSVLDFLLAQPGAARTGESRAHYGDAFRRHVLSIAAPDAIGHDLTREQLADAARVPLGTLQDWLREPDLSGATSTPTPAVDGLNVRQAHVGTILAEWSHWHGTFTAFCQHLRDQHRVPYGQDFVGSILHAAGLRQRKGRGQSQAPWSAGTFRTFFPGAQWLGDGTTIAIWLNSQCFTFNVEAMSDPASDALVGVTVGDAEDERAVIDTFEGGCKTAGDRPIALTLDNRPSNLTPGVADAIAPTVLLAATPGRGQAKAPLEGGFGLFQQTAPPLVIQGGTLREVARSVLELTMTIWAWARNGRPRTRLGGRAPRDFYRDAKPTPEEVCEVEDYLRELQRRQERIRRTRAARLDPVRIAILTEKLAQFDIPDPDGRIARQLAGFSRDAIVRGLATYTAKREADTLPAGPDPHRYLGGIIRNLHDRQELELTGRHLLELRLRLADLTLTPLETQADRIRESRPPTLLPREFVDKALGAESAIEFRFWSTAAATSIAALPPSIGRALYPDLNRRIAASFLIGYHRRSDLTDALAAAVTATA